MSHIHNETQITTGMPLSQEPSVVLGIAVTNLIPGKTPDRSKHQTDPDWLRPIRTRLAYLVFRNRLWTVTSSAMNALSHPGLMDVQTPQRTFTDSVKWSEIEMWPDYMTLAATWSSSLMKAGIVHSWWNSACLPPTIKHAPCLFCFLVVVFCLI